MYQLHITKKSEEIGKQVWKITDESGNIIDKYRTKYAATNGLNQWVKKLNKKLYLERI